MAQYWHYVPVPEEEIGVIVMMRGSAPTWSTHDRRQIVSDGSKSMKRYVKAGWWHCDPRPANILAFRQQLGKVFHVVDLDRATKRGAGGVGTIRLHYPSNQAACLPQDCQQQLVAQRKERAARQAEVAQQTSDERAEQRLSARLDEIRTSLSPLISSLAVALPSDAAAIPTPLSGQPAAVVMPSVAPDPHAASSSALLGVAAAPADTSISPLAAPRHTPLPIRLHNLSGCITVIPPLPTPPPPHKSHPIGGFEPRDGNLQQHECGRVRAA
jgi:hypothetical protein